MKTIASLAAPSQEKPLLVELRGALEAIKLEFQTLPELASEYQNLRAEVNRLMAFVETLG